MDNKIKFPALVISKNNVDKLNYTSLVANKAYVSKAFKDVLIVDFEGKCFETIEIKQSGGISILDSIKLFTKVVKVTPVLSKDVYFIDLNLLKDKLISVIWSNPKGFSNLDNIESLIANIQNCKRIEDVFKIF